METETENERFFESDSLVQGMSASTENLETDEHPDTQGKFQNILC